MYHDCPVPPATNYVSLPPGRPDPLPPKPTQVQWYRGFVPNNEIEENQTSREINRYLNPLHPTQIADNQLYLVEIETDAEAFSLEPHERIFFFGGKLTPLSELEEIIDHDYLQLLVSNNVYARLITNFGNTYWLQRDKHWHFNLDNNGNLQIPSADTDMAHQELEVIGRLHKLISSDHLTLNQAIKQLGSCSHDLEEGTAMPWQQLINYSCDKCGLGFSIDEFDPDLDFTQIYDAWPKLVERVGHDFAGLIFGGLKDLYLYNFRHIVMAEIPQKTARGMTTIKQKAWLDREGVPIID